MTAIELEKRATDETYKAFVFLSPLSDLKFEFLMTKYYQQIEQNYCR